jgi:uncharacterized membrane protein
MKLSKVDLVSFGLVALAAAASAAVYDRLPERVATHFALDGTPNGFMGRPYAAAGLPVLMLVCWALSRFSYRLAFDRRATTGPLATVAALTTALLFAVHGYILGRAVGWLDGEGGLRVVMMTCSAFFAGLGFLLPKIRRNPFVGVRTFWTLASEENWARTSRIGGAAMVIGGFASAVALMALPTAIGRATWLAIVLVASAVPTLYSVLLAHKLSSRSES